MTPRLKALISKLYRSHTGPRRVFAASRAEAERLPRLPTLAVISITAPELAPANLDGHEKLLRLAFADVDHLSPELSARSREKVSLAFTKDQGKQILEFVKALPPTVTSIVVHCEGGFSRSCAVAKALHTIFGYIVEPERLSKANPSVVQVLHQAAKLNGIQRA